MTKQDNMWDLLVSAVEGGSNYWATRMNSKAPKGVEFYAGVLKHGATFTVSADGEEEETFDVTPQGFIDALEIMREKYPKHYGRIGTISMDAVTGDVFLQCAVLGEIVYG